MKLTAYNPEKNIARVFDPDWEPFFRGSLRDFFPNEGSRVSYPRVNIAENENAFNLTVEVPGWIDKDIDVEIKEGVLSLRGHMKEEMEKTEENYRLTEFQSQNFERNFRIGAQIDPEKVSAKLDNGILRVTLAKKEIAKPKKVDIKINA